MTNTRELQCERKTEQAERKSHDHALRFTLARPHCDSPPLQAATSAAWEASTEEAIVDAGRAPSTGKEGVTVYPSKERGAHHNRDFNEETGPPLVRIPPSQTPSDNFPTERPI